MKFDDIGSALKASNTLSIKNGQVQIGSDLLDKTLPGAIFTPLYGVTGIEITSVTAASGNGPRMIVAKGKTLFPLLKTPLEVLATFELIGDQETLALTLRYALPQGWRFVDSFPEIPLMAYYDSRPFSDRGMETVLDSFKLKGCWFYWTTYERTLRDDDLGSSIVLEEGLNFAGHWVPDGMLGLFERLVKAAGASDKVLYGPVILKAAGPLHPLEDGKLPWDIRPRIPGIHLRADLGFDVSFPPDSDGGMKLKTLLLQIYSPLSLYQSAELPEYNFSMAYAGDLFIPSIGKNKLATMSAARSVGSSDQLVIAGAFESLTLNNLAAALKDIAGADDSSSVLPDEVREGIGGLGLTDASITLLRSDNGYEVAQSQFIIGMANAKPWALFGDLIQLKFEGLEVGVVRPFSADERALYATLVATTNFFGVELLAKVEYPGFHLSAKQVGDTMVDLRYFKKQGIRFPDFLDFEFKIADISIIAEPGSYYSFSMRLAPGKSWEIDGQYSLPDLRFAILGETPEGDGPYVSWRFGARTNEGDKSVPVLLLLRKLCTEVGITLPPAPSAIEGLTINRLELAHQGRAESYAIACWGQLPVNKTTTLDCRFAIEHTSGTSPETHFGGELLLHPEGLEPLSFSTKFGSAEDSKYFLAAYHDPNGYRLNVQSLAKSVLSADQAALIPASLEVSLNSALLAYSKQGQDATAESAVLFGVDIGASLKLSDLPVVGKALPAGLMIELKSMRVLVASAALSGQSVESINKLIPDGMKPLPNESQDGDEAQGKASAQAALTKGFNISAELLFGKESRTLTLPAAEGGERSTGKVETAPLPPNGQPGSPPAASPTPVPDESVKWFEIDKSLGPLSVRRVGFSYDAPRVGIKFDASLQLSVLTFNLEGLGLNYALGGSTEPSEILKNLSFTLDGMGLSLGNGPIEIGGSLVRVPGPNLELNGTLLIRSAAFSFSAIGSYADLNGTISVMAFAVLLKELGDPTGTGGFVVTGLAFGFGVNRQLTLPPIEAVRSFPLVQAAMGKQDLKSQTVLTEKLRDYMAPSAGNFWIAAGIKFNSFVVLDSFLLLSVSWGAEVEIGLLGLSRMTMPPLAPPEETIAGAELALRGVIRIADGLIQFEARLTENSFIFSRTCRLTGGFAFCVWFAGPHAGDFMVSLGGFHPAFVRPAHYPLVPRLGMNLQIGSELSITGEAYFALTTSCVMAGGRLCAVFKSGGIEAWFTAYADFLMSWQPFYYQAAMGITLGIALRLGEIALRLELSVDLKLQGPPFGGEARVVLWVISFTIPFGAPASAPPPLIAPEFIKKCLPAPKVPSEDTTPDVISVRITAGLLREQESAGKKRTVRIVNAHQLALTVQSVIPCTEFAGIAKGLDAKAPCGIRPMGKTNLHSVFSITAEGIRPGEHVQLSALMGNVPDALWGKSEKDGLVQLPQTPESKTIEATLGVRIVSVSQKPADGLPAIPIEKFKYERLSKRVDWAAVERPKYVRPAARWSDYSTIWQDNSVKQQRKEVLEFLRQQMPPDMILNEPHLERFSATKDYFQQHPEMNAVGY